MLIKARIFCGSRERQIVSERPPCIIDVLRTFERVDMWLSRARAKELRNRESPAIFFARRERPALISDITMAVHGMRAMVHAACIPRSSPRMALSRSGCYSANHISSTRRSVALLFAPRVLGVGA